MGHLIEYMIHMGPRDFAPVWVRSLRPKFCMTFRSRFRSLAGSTASFFIDGNRVSSAEICCTWICGSRAPSRAGISQREKVEKNFRSVKCLVILASILLVMVRSFALLER